MNAVAKRGWIEPAWSVEQLLEFYWSKTQVNVDESKKESTHETRNSL